MKKINDTKLYLYSAVVTITISVIVGIVSFYSIFSVEKEVENLLSQTENIDQNYKKAYIILRNPQIFAGYQNFDTTGMSVKNSIIYFDKLIYSGQTIDESNKNYLELLLNRRKQGSRLGRNTMIYFLLVSIICFIFFFVEKRQNI